MINFMEVFFQVQFFQNDQKLACLEIFLLYKRVVHLGNYMCNENTQRLTINHSTFFRDFYEKCLTHFRMTWITSIPDSEP